MVLVLNMLQYCRKPLHHGPVARSGSSPRRSLLSVSRGVAPKFRWGSVDKQPDRKTSGLQKSISAAYGKSDTSSSGRFDGSDYSHSELFGRLSPLSYYP